MSSPVVISVLWLAVVMLLVGRAFVQRHALQRLDAATPGNGPAPGVAVIVPARDEAQNIAPCVDALLAQNFPAERVAIRIIDDCSSDATAAIVLQRAAYEPRVKLLSAPPLPDGWTGKSHACWLAARSIPDGVDWLCFIDADMRAGPALLQSAVSVATQENLSLLSLVPRHKFGSFAERLIIPCGLCFLAFRQDLRGARADHAGSVVATGQFFLVRRQVYNEVRGHAAVASEICEDLAFARLLKARGERVAMKDGSELLSTRMYTGWRTLWPGFAKNLTEMLGGPVATLFSAGVSIAMAGAALLLPWVDALSCHGGHHEACLAFIPASLATLVLFAFHIAAVLSLGIPLGYGLLWPLGYVIGAAMAFDSLRWRLVGRVSWKGRTYRAVGPAVDSQ